MTLWPLWLIKIWGESKRSGENADTSLIEHSQIYLQEHRDIYKSIHTTAAWALYHTAIVNHHLHNQNPIY